MPAQSSRAGRSHPTLIPGRSAPWPVWAGAGVLAIAAAAAYGRTFSDPLVFDDIPAIAANPTIRHWASALLPPLNTTASGRPILNLSLTINYAISGSRVWSYHALNLAIHILAGWTLLGVARRTLHSARAAFAIALLWTLHPLQTESVTYVVQRAESLMGLFYLLTLYCFIRGVDAEADRNPAGRAFFLWFGLSWLACLFGMGTKEVMVSAPLIVLLYDRAFVAGSFREAWRRRGRIHVALVSTWLILPWLVLSTHGRNGNSGFGSGISWWKYALTQSPAIMRYLKLSVWPHPLVFDYGTQWVANFWSVLPSAAVVTALVAATGYGLLHAPLTIAGRAGGPAAGRRKPAGRGQALAFAGVWFFAILAPTSLVPGNRQTSAEHRMYLALIPVIALAVIAIFRRLGRGALPFCLVLAGGLFALTWRRNEDYRSVLGLWSDTVAKNPANPQAQDNLGNSLESVPGRSSDAIAHFQEALRLQPDLAAAHNNLGNAFVTMPGRLDDAIAQYEEAVHLNPDLPETRNNLGNALNREGRMPEAVAQYEEALRLKPDYAEAHLDLAITLLDLPGRTVEAVTHLEAALRLEPGMESAREILASVRAAPR